MSAKTVEIWDPSQDWLARWHQMGDDDWLGYSADQVVVWVHMGAADDAPAYVRPGTRATTAEVIRYVAALAAADMPLYTVHGGDYWVPLARTMHTADLARIFDVDAAAVREALAGVLVFA